jgi:hypothetical protein
MPLLTTADCVEIRSLIGVDISAANLPDAIITLDSYMGRAMREVEAATSDTGAHAKLAARMICAAYLISIVPHFTSEHIPGASYNRQQVDWEARKAELRDDALVEINLANAMTTETLLAETSPPFFTVAPAGEDT